MDYDFFITLVEQHAGVGREKAERAVRATLETLAERVAAGEAQDIAEALPPEVSGWLETTTDAEGFDVDEFLRRVAEREGVDIPTAERDVRAVFNAVARALSDNPVYEKEFSEMVAQLSKDFWPLLPKGPWIEVVSHDTFLQRVADRAGIRLEDAQKASEAVLETLAERIAGGEVEDLIARLPTQFHLPLRRGIERTGGKATKMSVDEFVRRVAEREGVSEEDARDHIRAVFVTLREAVGDDEFFDVTVQLPADYPRAAVRSG
jgi:uncharacterized protein (DUF2267 family)